MSVIRKAIVLYQRNEKAISFVLYGILISISLLAIYDPGTVIELLFPGYVQPPEVPQRLEDDLENYLPIYFRFTTTPRILPDLRALDIPFLPTRHKCDDLFQRAGKNFSYSEFYFEHMDAYKTALSMTGMMQEANVNEQSWAFHELGRVNFVNNVCETGFHAGHNTFQFLSAKPEVTVYSFEKNAHNWTEDMAVFLSAEFPDHFYFYSGNTSDTIPKFHREHNTTKCDLLYVDSSADENAIRREIGLFRKVANQAENFFVMDAHGSLHESLAFKIWQSLIKDGVIKDHYHCEFADQGDMLSTRSHNVSGFLVGSFINFKNSNKNEAK